MYNDQIPDFTIIIHGIHNTPNRDYENRQSRDNSGNSAPNYIIRFELRSTTAPKTSRFDISKYNITAPRFPQLQNIYHDIIKKPQSRSQYTPSQSHIPRAFENNHDNDEIEKIYFVKHEHNCNVIDCSHRYNN